MTDETCNRIPKPGSLKDILELLEVLTIQHSVKSGACEKHYRDVLKYCSDASVFYRDGSGCLAKVFNAAKGIREKILQNTRDKKYANIDRHSNCISKVLPNTFSQLYSALYFLYFNTSSKLSSIHGGNWSDQKCNGLGGFTDVLQKWLNDNDNHPTIGLIKRGFDIRDKLTSYTGKDVASEIQMISMHDNPGNLQKAMSYILFLGEWHRAKLGHACLFLLQFCESVDGLKSQFNEKYPDEEFETFKSICEGLKSDLSSLVQGTNGHLYAVCMNNSTLYKDILNEDYLENYLDWLTKNIERIILSLNYMVTDCQTLSAASILQQSLSAGPFTYGFVFKEGWENNIRSDLPSVIDHLTQSLNKLNAILLKLQPKSPGTVNSSDTLHSSGEYSTEDSQTESENDDTSGSSEGSSTASIVGASVGTLGGTAALGGLGYFLRGFLFGV